MKWYSTRNESYGDYVLSTLLVLLIWVGTIAIIVAYPMAMIWVMNTLFPALAINYTFWTWLAMFFANLHIVGLFKYAKKG